MANESFQGKMPNLLSEISSGDSATKKGVMLIACDIEDAREIQPSDAARSKRPSLAAEQARSSIVRTSKASDSGITKLEVILSLVTAIIGCGIVALPGLMKKAGWYLGPAIAVFTGFCFMEVGCFMHEAITRRDENPEVEEKIGSFDDFGHAAYGEVGVTMVKSVVTFMFFGYMIVYQVLIGNNISVLLPMDTCDKPQVGVLMFCISPILCGLGMLKDMAAIAKFMPIGAACAIGGCILICYGGLADAQTRTDSWMNGEEWTDNERLFNFWPESFSALGTVIAVVFASYAVMGTVPTIRSEMRDQREFPSAFRIAICIVLGLYVAAMVCGYAAYGNFVKDNVVNSMAQYPKDLVEAREAIKEGTSVFTGPTSPYVGRIMALMVIINLILSFPVYFQCVIRSVERMSPEAGWATFGNSANVLLRVILILSATTIGALVPYFRDVLAILASVACSCNNILFPLFFAYKLNAGLVTMGPAKKVAHFAIISLALVCLVLGLIDAVGGLIKKIEDGPPSVC
jgi:amino acid permease